MLLKADDPCFSVRTIFANVRIAMDPLSDVLSLRWRANPLQSCAAFKGRRAARRGGRCGLRRRSASVGRSAPAVASQLDVADLLFADPVRH